MARLRIRHMGLRLLSVAVAALLWLVVAGDPVVERTLRVGIELQGMPPGMELVETVPDTVAVRVRGAAGRLAALAPGDVIVVLDLDGLAHGRHALALTTDGVTAPSGVEIVQVSPSAVPFTLDRTASKTVPVRVTVTGSPAPGHSVANLMVQPQAVRVEGPASVVGPLSEVATVPVSVEGATTAVRTAAPLSLAEPGLRVAGSSTVMVTVAVAVDPALPTAQTAPRR